jgi:hypothetical protein
MLDTINLERESQCTLQRILPRLEKEFAVQISTGPKRWKEFSARLQKHFTSLFRLYFSLYSTRYDFFFHIIEDLLVSLARSWFTRADKLRKPTGRAPIDSSIQRGGAHRVTCFALQIRGDCPSQ